MAFEKLALDTAKQRARISRPLFMYLVRIFSSVIQHNVLHIGTYHITQYIILTKPLQFHIKLLSLSMKILLYCRKYKECVKSMCFVEKKSAMRVL